MNKFVSSKRVAIERQQVTKKKRENQFKAIHRVLRTECFKGFWVILKLKSEIFNNLSVCVCVCVFYTHFYGCVWVHMIMERQDRYQASSLIAFCLVSWDRTIQGTWSLPIQLGWPANELTPRDPPDDHDLLMSEVQTAPLHHALHMSAGDWT